MSEPPIPSLPAAEPDQPGARRALALSTIAFMACFACWVINSVLVSHLARMQHFPLTEVQVGGLLAVPFLTGALSRVPLGMLTDRLGGRVVFGGLLLVVAASLVALSRANGYGVYLGCSLGVGLSGGGFAVGVGYVSAFFPKAKQGTALGVFGLGNAGAALTTAAAPWLLGLVTRHGLEPQGWRKVPLVYAAVMALLGAIFLLLAPSKSAAARGQPMGSMLKLLRDAVVWRFSLYYMLVFGGFVALAQWLVPYGVGAYGLSLAQAGAVASAFSLPSGVVRAGGGWLSDRFGAGKVMYWVFGVCVLCCLWLSVPRMDIVSPGEGVAAKGPGVVTSVQATAVQVGQMRYRLTPRLAQTPARQDDGTALLPAVARWHTPVVSAGQKVERQQLLAEGQTNIYYPANFNVFVLVVFVFGVVTGVGKAGVYKFIPERYPDAVGLVGGLVGMLGALGGFVLPPLFGYLLGLTGLWVSCWWALLLVSLVCLGLLHTVQRRILDAEVPDLVRLLERDRSTPGAVPGAGTEPAIAGGLARVPFFAALKPEQLNQLASSGAVREVAAGEEVFRQGEPGETLYVVLSGLVAVEHTDEQGQTRRVAALGRGEFFGELSLIDGRARSATVRAIEGGELFVLGRREFLIALGHSPRLVANLLQGMSARLRGTMEPRAKAVPARSEA